MRLYPDLTHIEILSYLPNFLHPITYAHTCTMPAAIQAPQKAPLADWGSGLDEAIEAAPGANMEFCPRSEQALGKSNLMEKRSPGRPQKLAALVTGEVRGKIIALMDQEKALTQAEMAKELGLSRRSFQRLLKILTDRHGGDEAEGKRGDCAKTRKN